ncbi:MAG: hypothetical protein KJZ84_23035 [Bryobacteraceae bacterium]|nr:hypothetical protein [Bryobacteraceae bacterium]
MRWAIILPTINAVLYVILVALSRPPGIQRVPEHWDVDFYTTVPERILYAVNAPALWLAAGITDVFGQGERRLIWLIGAVFAVGLWCAIGLWLDRLPTRARSSPRTFWRERERQYGAVMLFLVLLFIGFTWPEVFADWQSSAGVGFETIAGLLLWPILVGVVASLTLFKGLQYRR